MKTKTLFQSLGHAAAVLAYVAGVAWVLSHGEAIFGPEEPKNFLIPVGMLLLFVFSAATTGALVLGRPIVLYLGGQKSEAIRFFVYTLAWLFVIILSVFLFYAKYYANTA